MTFPAFPYATSDFADGILAKWKETAFDVSRYDANAMTGSGANIPTELAVPKWKATVNFADLTLEEILFLETRIRKLQGQINAAMFYDPRRRYPYFDALGAVLMAGSSLSIGGIAASGDFTTQSYSLEGLPAVSTDAASCSRASTATYCDSTGTLQTAAANALRLDYDPTNLVVAGATNLFLQSASLDVTPWFQQAGVGVVANATLAPDGTTTAEQLVCFGLNSQQLLQSVSLTAGTNTFTQSVYLKAGSNSKPRFDLRGTGGTAKNYDYQLDLIALTATPLTGDVGTVVLTPTTNGWVRVSITGVAAANTQLTMALYPGGSTSTAGYIYAWGAQLEAGTVPTPYIATTTAAVTRAPLYKALGALVEALATNSIQNNTGTGAVVAGALPTGWVVTAAAGLTTTVAAVGADNGVDYVDLLISGTPTASSYSLSLGPTTSISALPAQNWTYSSYLAFVGGSLANLVGGGAFIILVSRQSSGSGIASPQQVASITSTLTRYALTYSNLPALTAFINPLLALALTVGQPVNLTLRVGLPQCELGTVATSPIRTTNAAATRGADTLTLKAVGTNTWTGTYDDGSAASFGGAIGGIAIAPSALGRPHIATYKAVRVAQPGPASPVVASIGSDQASMTISGLPPNYQIAIGDKGQVSYGSGQNYFFEFSEPNIASGAGILPLTGVWPYIPISVVAGASVNLIKPACKMTVESFDPGISSSKFNTGATMQLLEHI